jgi:hypothetical protein
MEGREQQLSTRDLAGDDRPADEGRAGPDEGTVTTAERDTTTGPDDRSEHDPTTPPDDALARDAQERDEPASTAELSDDGAGGADALLPHDENARFQERWQEIQTGFVDEPRQTVEQADELVAQVMKRLAEGFAAERERLEQQWGRGEDISTEDLRVALQRYRAFFQRLLSA